MEYKNSRDTMVGLCGGTIYHTANLTQIFLKNKLIQDCEAI